MTFSDVLEVLVAVWGIVLAFGLVVFGLALVRDLREDPPRWWPPHDPGPDDPDPIDELVRRIFEEHDAQERRDAYRRGGSPHWRVP